MSRHVPPIAVADLALQPAEGAGKKIFSENRV
jgi:hypothetical protein